MESEERDEKRQGDVMSGEGKGWIRSEGEKREMRVMWERGNG